MSTVKLTLVDEQIGICPKLWFAVASQNFCYFILDVPSKYNRKGFPKTIVFIERGIPLYHRSGEKPLDPTTLLIPTQNL